MTRGRPETFQAKRPELKLEPDLNKSSMTEKVIQKYSQVTVVSLLKIFIKNYVKCIKSFNSLLLKLW